MSTPMFFLILLLLMVFAAIVITVCALFITQLWEGQGERQNPTDAEQLVQRHQFWEGM